MNIYMDSKPASPAIQNRNADFVPPLEESNQKLQWLRWIT